MTRASDTARLVSGGAVFNEASNDVDFRVESNGNANMLVVNAGDDRVGIGTNAPASPLHISGSNGVLATLGATTELEIYVNNNEISFRADADNDENDTVITFDTDGSERMRIDNANHVMFYTTSDAAPDGNGGVIIADDGNGSFIQISKKTTSAVPAMEFYNANGRVGQIIPSGSATSFTTSSDYRLKENVTASWDATTRLKQLKPSRFNFKADKDTVLDGFLAHEVSSIVPEAITGAKDAVDKDGKPEYQGIDQSKLVPLLTKSLQEALARIDTLEAEVTKLKG